MPRLDDPYRMTGHTVDSVQAWLSDVAYRAQDEQAARLPREARRAASLLLQWAEDWESREALRRVGLHDEAPHV